MVPNMVTREQALVCQRFQHCSIKYKSRGMTDQNIVCRANGKCKTWKRRPDDFRLPVKFGHRECFYITPHNAHEWTALDWETKSKHAVTLKEIIESSPIYAERFAAFAEHWAESRVFPIVMLNYLVDECGTDHPEWDLYPLLDRLQWIVDCPTRTILMPLSDIGEDPTPAPFYPSADCYHYQMGIKGWMIRISPTTRFHEYFTTPDASAHVIPFDVTATGDPNKPDTIVFVLGKTAGECLFNLLKEEM